MDDKLFMLKGNTSYDFSIENSWVKDFDFTIWSEQGIIMHFNIVDDELKCYRYLPEVVLIEKDIMEEIDYFIKETYVNEKIYRIFAIDGNNTNKISEINSDFKNFIINSDYPKEIEELFNIIIKRSKNTIARILLK